MLHKPKRPVGQRPGADIGDTLLKPFASKLALMVRIPLLVVAALCVVAPFQARACSLRGPPLEEMVNGVASEGVLIRGTVVQSFDAKTRQPEIVRAEEIFIGEGQPRDFIIHFTDEEADRVPGASGAPCGERHYPEVGRTYDRLVLLPAKGPDGTANGKWHRAKTGPYPGGHNLDLLVQAAQRTGRYKSRPPGDGQWGD